MKALTIRQPWAHAILHLGKDIENRDWFSTLRGRIAIHASKTMTRREITEARDFVQSMVGLDIAQAMPAKGNYPVGSIVGVATVRGCVQRYDSPWFVGRYGFVLEDPIALPEPIPMRGQLSFWDVPEDVVAEINRQIGVTK